MIWVKHIQIFLQFSVQVNQITFQVKILSSMVQNYVTDNTEEFYG